MELMVAEPGQYDANVMLTLACSVSDWESGGYVSVHWEYFTLVT